MKTVGRLRTALFACGVGSALAFGITAARAEAHVPECTDPNANGICSTTAYCRSWCQQNLGSFTGSCQNYCCYCIDLH